MLGRDVFKTSVWVPLSAKLSYNVGGRETWLDEDEEINISCHILFYLIAFKVGTTCNMSVWLVEVKKVFEQRSCVNVILKA